MLGCLVLGTLGSCTSSSEPDPPLASGPAPVAEVMSTTHLEDLLIRNAGRLGVPGVGSVVCAGPLSDGGRVDCALITADITRQVQVSFRPGGSRSTGDVIVEPASGPDVRIRVQGAAH